jgi:AcrR family transcriptional regulator
MPDEVRSPASAKGVAQRTRILDAATALLVEEGYGGLSLRKVADRLGLRLSNVQYYFPLRDDLLEALFARSLTNAQEDFARSADAHDIEAVTRYILGKQNADGACPMFWEMWALSARDAGVRAVMTSYYTAYRGVLEGAIAALAPDGTEDQRRHRATVIMSLLEGISLFRGKTLRLPDTGVALDELDDEIVGAVRRIAMGA